MLEPIGSCKMSHKVIQWEEKMIRNTLGCGLDMAHTHDSSDNLDCHLTTSIVTCMEEGSSLDLFNLYIVHIAL